MIIRAVTETGQRLNYCSIETAVDRADERGDIAFIFVIDGLGAASIWYATEPDGEFWPAPLDDGDIAKEVAVGLTYLICRTRANTSMVRAR